MNQFETFRLRQVFGETRSQSQLETIVIEQVEKVHRLLVLRGRGTTGEVQPVSGADYPRLSLGPTLSSRCLLQVDLAPNSKSLQHLTESLSMLRKTVFDSEWNFGEQLTANDSFTFQLAELKGECVLGDAGNVSPERVEARRSPIQDPDDQKLPLAAHHT